MNRTAAAAIALNKAPDELLAELAQQGDHLAGELLARRYVEQIQSAVHGFFIPGATSDDVYAAAMVGFTQAIHTFEPGRGSFKAFAKRCAIADVIDSIKSEQRHKREIHHGAMSLSMATTQDNGDDGYRLEEVIPDAGALGRDPVELVAQRTTVKKIRGFIRTGLSPAERTTVIGIIVGATYSSIGKVLGRPGDHKYVDNVVTRARRKLRRELGRSGESGFSASGKVKQ